jgi:hypothetical protein
MSKYLFIAAVVVYLILIGLGIYLRVGKDARQTAAQVKINERIIKALDDQIEANELVLEYLKAISKKPGH